MTTRDIGPEGNAWALLPVGVFLVLYLGLGIVFEYVLGIEMGFYAIPIVVAFMVAIGVACMQRRGESFDEKIATMARGVGDSTIMTMILIFLTAGVFVGTVGRDSAESVAYFMLSVMPAQWAVAVLFVVACFVSTSMGTSCGTIALIAPIGVAVAQASGFDTALCIASVMGGAMFGDNLSFISDTTIAACSTQGCKMRDKFRANFFIALPAAILTLIIILCVSASTPLSGEICRDYSLIQLIPYILVLAGGVAGINVFVVLVVGIVSGSVIMLCEGAVTPIELMRNMGTGCAGSFETSMVAVLVAALCALIRVGGGFEALLRVVSRWARGKRGGKLGIGMLVGAMDVATANNTVAIVMAGPIARDMANRYGITPRESASILDIFGCIVQGVLPYGAQMLYAVSASVTLGHAVSAFDIIPFLYYPGCLLACVVISVLAKRESASH